MKVWIHSLMLIGIIVNTSLINKKIWKYNWNNIFKYLEGWLYWKIKPAYNVNIGDLAGNISKNSNGYCSWQIRYNKINFIASRLIWEIHFGTIPEEMEIDHIDGDSLNNKIENLRLATRQQQKFNSTLHKNNTSGYKGIYWDKQAKRWRAQIDINNKTIHLGNFDTPEEASNAYNIIAKEAHGEFYRE